MRRYLDSELFERLLFSVIVMGILLAGVAAIQYLGLSNQLAGNMAARIHEDGGEVAIETKGQAQGLMAADIERRRLQTEQSNMMVVGGVGLALLGLGWLARDLTRGQRREAQQKQSESNITAS